MPLQGLPRAALPSSCRAFETTELNGVFYRTPTLETVKAWRDQTGRDFVFIWKATNLTTHGKRLSERSENSLDLLESRISFLRGKVGPILFQLPPQFEADPDRLGSFFKLLSRERCYSFEFRRASWYQPRVLRMLANKCISLYLSDASRCVSSLEAHGTSCMSADTVQAALSRPLLADSAHPVGRAPQIVEAARLRLLCLFRQRPEECGAGRRAGVERTAVATGAEGADIEINRSITVTEERFPDGFA